MFSITLIEGSGFHRNKKNHKKTEEKNQLKYYPNQTFALVSILNSKFKYTMCIQTSEIKAIK